MKTTTKKIAGMVGILAVVSVILLAYPVMAAQQQSTTTTQLPTNAPSPAAQSREAQKLDLKVGQTIAVTTVAGDYRAPGATTQTGQATASLTLQVTGVFQRGYALSITSGTITLGTTTYTITGGSAELGPYGVHMLGQGAGNNGVQFLFHGRSIGTFNETHYGVLRVDFSDGSTEYFAHMLVSETIS